MKETVDAIQAAGLRDDVKIMIGGAPVDEHVQEYAGADAWGADAMQAVSLAKMGRRLAMNADAMQAEPSPGFEIGPSGLTTPSP